MTIRRLKEIIANLPDSARIYLDDGHELFEGNSEIVAVAAYGEPFDKKVLMQTREDFDVKAELDARREYASDHDEDEHNFWWDLYEDGYTPEDFEGIDYQWAKENFENYGLD